MTGRSTSLITNLHHRSTESLDGGWKAIIDPYDFGYLDLFGRPSGRGFARDFTPRHRGDRVEYDFDSSVDLVVPGDWNTQHPELLYYEGTVWYRRRVEIDQPEQGRTFLNVGAANHTTRVFLDGEELALHQGGFGPFAVELTGRLGPGSHSLVMMVDNRRQPERIPAMRADWWNFGGITGSVALVRVPPTFIRDAWLTMAPDGSLVGEILVDGVEGFDRAPVGSVELPQLGLAATVDLEPIGPDRRWPWAAEPAPSLVRGRFRLDGAGVERWHPGRPVLHQARFTVPDPAGQGPPVDRVDDEIGFRTVAVDGTDVVVNHEPVFLRGISLHAEGPSGGRRTRGGAEAEILCGWAAELGANFVRLAHYQHDEAMVRTADRLGLLAWCEVPVYWGIDFANPATLDNGLDQLTELIVRDRSRASVALWSVANETLPTAERTIFLSELVAEARRLDPTRLVAAALFTEPTDATEVVIDDPLGHQVDVIGVNQYLGWYYGDRASIAATTWTSTVGKPIVFSELGAGAKAGHHGDPDEIWTEEFQAAVYVEQLAMIDACPDCAGLSPWILKDFRTPIRVLPGIQDGYNRKGLVSEEGERKAAFDVVRRYYRKRQDQGR